MLDEAEKEEVIKTSYEKVEQEIFDLKDEFEKGELYFQNNLSGNIFEQIKNEEDIASGLLYTGVYRKVEKPVEWWENLSEKNPILCVVRMREMHPDQKSIAKIVRSAMTGRFLDINGCWWDDARPLNEGEKKSLLGMLV